MQEAQDDPIVIYKECLALRVEHLGHEDPLTMEVCLTVTLNYES